MAGHKRQAWFIGVDYGLASQSNMDALRRQGELAGQQAQSMTRFNLPQRVLDRIARGRLDRGLPAGERYER